MSARPLFNQNARLNSPLPEKDMISVSWLMKVLPDFGIVQLAGHRAAKIQARFEQEIRKQGMDASLVIWDSTDQFSEYAELLAGVLDFASTDYVFLQSGLRKWAENGGVLWIFVDASVIPNQQLLQLLRYNPVSRNGQCAIRIVLKISDDKLRNKSLSLLADAIHERVGDAVSSEPKPYKTYAVYLSVVVVAAVSIAATLFLASAKQSPLIEITSSNSLSQNTTSQRLMAENEIKDDQAQGITPEQKIITQILLPKTDVVAAQLSEKNEVLAFVEQWSRAWQEKNSDGFLSMYSDDFSGYKHMSPKEWRLWRKPRLLKPEWITIQIGLISIERDTEGELRVKFWQLYRTPGYQDDTLKILLLRKEGDLWKIKGEIKEEVRPLSQ